MGQDNPRQNLELLKADGPRDVERATDRLRGGVRIYEPSAPAALKRPGHFRATFAK